MPKAKLLVPKGADSNKSNINNEKSSKPFSSSPPKSQAAERSLTSLDRRLLAGLALFSSVIRLHKLSQPSSIVFDEVHFGGFARKYIIGRFFMDVHPPLAKMLFAVVGYLAGYDGEFEFKTIGIDYISNNVPYVAMRLFPAVLGVFTVLLSYSTLRASGCRSITSLFGAGLMTLDNALTTQSRFILLDSPLIFFMALTAYAFVKFQNEVPLQKDWFRYLFLTGIGLGATVSSKWVGLFTIGWVGVLTVWQLWWILGDLTVTPTNYIKQFMSRAVLLIGVPVVFYLAMFYLHFICLSNQGDGASFLSPEFQATLQHSPLRGKFPADVAFGSTITIRHVNTKGGYLHSHAHNYPSGSKQQQITLYPHKDNNNNWLVENITQPENATVYEHKEPVLIQDGTVIRLNHIPTFHRLHSHDVRPPVTEQDYQNEVSGYGYEGFGGDANDHFRVEILKDWSAKGKAQTHLRAMETKFKLVHVMSGCVLFSHNVKLPKWGFEQQEVTCVKGASLANSIWQIEQNSHPLMTGDNVEFTTYRTPSFLEKFIELNKVMWRINSDLTETHPYQSRPQSWPFMLRGINFWSQDHRQVYLIGNAVTWFSFAALIFGYTAFKLFALIRWQRGYPKFTSAAYETYDKGVTAYILGWAFHYFPSFLMDRQLFLHHYLGSVYFGILALSQFWDFLSFRLINNKIVRYTLLGLYFSLASAFFAWYSPLIYGSTWTRDLCEKSKFFDMDFNCNTFFGNYSDYESYENSASTTTKSEIVSSDTNNNPIEVKGNEQVVYQDGDGNILDPKVVEELMKSGDVSLEERFEKNGKFYNKNGEEIADKFA